MVLPQAHELGVVVVVERGIEWQAVHQKALYLVVALESRMPQARTPGSGRGDWPGPPRAVAPQDPETREDAPGVGVDDEEGLPGGVESDRVGGLRTDARHRQELAAQGFRPFRPHLLDPPAVLRAEEVEEGSQPPGLHAKRPGGAQQRREAWHGDAVERLEGEKRPGSQSVEGALDVRPGGVLDQDGPDADLERGLAGPPPGVTEAREQATIDAEQESACPRPARLAPWPCDDSPRARRGKSGLRKRGRDGRDRIR